MRQLFIALVIGGLVGLAGAAQAAIVELNISASWEASDFDVSSTGTTNPNDPTIEENDDKVFGIAPSDGSISFTLLVDTSNVTAFEVGGPELVVRNHYGYSDVTLKDTVTLGTATWETADILTGLQGPGGVEAALWTDTDLNTGDPTRLSFRMFGEWTGTGGTGTADMFFGSRFLSASGYDISESFLTWEYYLGEEIRTTGYTATVSNVPLPASSLLLLAGLGGMAAMRRRVATR